LHRCRHGDVTSKLSKHVDSRRISRRFTSHDWCTILKFLHGTSSTLRSLEPLGFPGDAGCQPSRCLLAPNARVNPTLSQAHSIWVTIFNRFQSSSIVFNNEPGPLVSKVI
jgi:hypothetical protein